MAHSNLKGRARIPAAKPKGYLTVREAMRRTGCSEVTLRRWIQRRLLTVVRWRERVLIREKDLVERDRVRLYRRKPRPAPAVTSIAIEVPQPEANASAGGAA